MSRRVRALLVLALTLVAMIAFSGLASAQEAAHGCGGINEALSRNPFGKPKGKVPQFVPPAKDVVGSGLFIPPFRDPCLAH